jgi:hypothetical protein
VLIYWCALRAAPLAERLEDPSRLPHATAGPRSAVALHAKDIPRTGRRTHRIAAHRYHLRRHAPNGSRGTRAPVPVES